MLASALPLVDAAIVVDTGSTDDTPAIARAAGVTRVYRRRWRGFGASRTTALRLAAELGTEWLLWVDADEELDGELDEPGRELGFTSFGLRVDDGGPAYWQPRLLATGPDWRFVGPTHEYLTAAVDRHPGHVRLQSPTVRHHCDGARRPRKFTEDAELLEAHLAKHPSDERAVFYLANTYRDLGAVDQAVTLYRRRATMGGWELEAGIAARQAIMLEAGDTTRLGLPS